MREARCLSQVRQRRVSGEQRQHGHRYHHRLAPEAVAEHAADGQPEEVRYADQQRHQQGVGGGQVEYGLAEGRCIHGDQVEGAGGHCHHQHAADDNTPVAGQCCHHLLHGRTMGAIGELFGFLQAAPQQEDERDDHATHGKRYAPAPFADLLRRQPLVQAVAQCCGNDDRHLLAAGLPAGVEALAPRRGHFRQVDRHPAQFGASREALQQPSEQDQGRCPQANAGVSGHQHDQQRTAGHDRQGHDQTFAPAHVIDVGTEHNGAQRAHEEACAEHRKGHHQGSEFTRRRKECGRNLSGVKAEQEEVELLEKITRGDAEHGCGAGTGSARSGG
ncbi:hypothetical protein PS631_04843 [Pseudomonas fluorescens]|uniref:Uncharacterized protein n=1 Tax=Pseudomonas fluorescens TaxID=294 RepID=A0A5E6WPT8_PSEFL|nr:hypothetical protein PS631_04843 [Pseudomonas fluorescens]